MEEKKKFLPVAAMKKWIDGIKGKIEEKSNARKAKQAEKMQSDEMLSLAEKLKIHKSKVHLRTLLLTVAAVLLVGGCAIFHYVRVFHNYRTLRSAERSDDSATEYVRLGNRTLKCNPNGVTCVNDSNEVQWNVTFTIQNPVVDVCDTKVAVGDQNGSEIYIFDKNGLVGSFETEYTLQKVRVASQGVVAAVLEDGETTLVNVYDSQGTLIVKNQTTMTGEMGYPVDIDISSDGQKLVVSYLGMNDNNIVTKVAFYNFSSVGQNESDYLVNSAEYEGRVVPQVNFLDGNYAVAFRDDGLTFFGGRQVPEQKAEITTSQEIISAFCNDGYVGFVTESDEEEQTHKYKMQTYHNNGAKAGTTYFDLDYTKIAAEDDEIILYNDQMFEIYQTSGHKKASVKYDKSIVQMMNVSGFRAYEVIAQDSIDKIRLK